MTKQAELMSVREAALELGCTIPYMYLLLHGRRIEGQQTDGRWLVPVDAVQTYKATHPRIGAARRYAAIKDAPGS